MVVVVVDVLFLLLLAEEMQIFNTYYNVIKTVDLCQTIADATHTTIL